MTESEKEFIKAAKKGDLEKLKGLLKNEKGLLVTQDLDVQLHYTTQHGKVIVKQLCSYSKPEQMFTLTTTTTTGELHHFMPPHMRINQPYYNCF